MTTAKTYIVTFKSAFLPKFIDAHKMNKAFCVLNAPNKEAAEKTPPEDRPQARLDTRGQDYKVTIRFETHPAFFISCLFVWQSRR